MIDDDLIVISDAADDMAALGVDAAQTPEPKLPANAVVNADGSVTLTLRWPAGIKFKGADGSVREESVGETLVFQRLRGGDLRAMMKADGSDASLVLFNRSTRLGDGRGPLTFDALDADDASAAMEIVSFLAGFGRKTGR